MTQVTLSQNAYSQTIEILNTSSRKANPIASEHPATTPSKIFRFESYQNKSEFIPVKFKTVENLIERSEKLKSRKEALEKARKRMSEHLSNDEGETIRSLRMARGWSQSYLAKLVSTSQPHIARIERGNEDVRIETCRKLCAALEIDMNKLNEITLNQQKNFKLKAK